MEFLEKLDFSSQHLTEDQKQYIGTGIKCLDHGHVYLVDMIGNDDAIAEAARTSYGKGTKKTTDNEKLIRYLLKHAHTSPLEMVSMKFRIKLPIFVMRQLVRQRTAKLNEYSMRYSEALEESYLPGIEWITTQDPMNKQGGTNTQIPDAAAIRNEMKLEQINNKEHYQKYLKTGMRRELARINTTVAQYTECYWKLDLNNLLKFLKLRMDSHSQIEIREFANAIAYFVEKCYPYSYKAFIDYMYEAKTFSRMEMVILKDIIKSSSYVFSDQKMKDLGMTDREITEFKKNILG